MATAMYRIGPADFFTPDDLAADARTLNGQINALDGANWDAPVPQDLFDGFQAFLSEWRAFYSSSFGGFFTNLTTALNDANRDQLIQYEARFATFADQYASAAGRKLPGGVINVSTGAKDNFGSQLLNQLQPIIPSFDAIYVLAGIGVVGFLVYLFREPIGRAIKKVTS